MEKWQEGLLLAYKSLQSNVAIAITEDFERIQQVAKMFSEKERDMPYYVWDVNLNIVWDADGRNVTDKFPLTPPDLLEYVRTHKILLIISYIYSQQLADSITPLLVSMSMDDKVFSRRSFIVVFTNSTENFPKPLLRMSIIVDIPPSTQEERKNKLYAIAAEASSAGIKIEITSALIQAGAGLNLKEIETVALKSLATRKTIDVEEFSNYKTQLLKSMGLELIQPRTTFNHIGGYTKLKQYIRQRFVKVLKNPEIAERYGLSLPKGLILYGLPGTGKTVFSLALAHEVGLPMVKLTPDKLFHGIVGESEKAVRNIAKTIEAMAPVIVFVDEADQLFINRSQINTMTDSGVTSRVVGGLLEWLGDPERKAFVIAATNYVDRIDPALMRPGRMDEVIPIYPPDAEARLQILKIHTEVVRRVPLSADLEEVVRATDLFTGAEIEKVVLDAASMAMMEDKPVVTTDDLLQAVNSTGFDRTLREQRIREMTQVLSKLENVNRSLITQLTQTSDSRLKQLISNL
ncbi:MAG: ATP-binding protein [Candidatus Caldarchaeum sp.]